MTKYTVTIKDLVENNVNIFDFDYPIFREEYRKTFEENFIDFFMFHEIGQETIERFKHTLKIRLRVIMPYWNRIYLTQELDQRILDNYDVREVYNSKNISKGKANSLSLLNDTPKTKVDVDKIDYFSSLGKNTADTQGENTSEYTIHKTGNIGVATDADAIVSYWKSLRNVDLEVFKNLEEFIFMGVY